MRFAQSLLFLLVASVANGLPIALNDHFGLIHAIQSDAAAASETYLKAVASTSITFALIRTPLPETIVSAGSSSMHRSSSDIPGNNTTTETSAGTNNLATESPATFLEVTFTSSAPSSTTPQTISSPHIVTSSSLVTTLVTSVTHTPTLTSSPITTTSDAQPTPFSTSSLALTLPPQAPITTKS